MIIVSGWKPLTVITKSSNLDVAAVLDPPLIEISKAGNNNGVKWGRYTCTVTYFLEKIVDIPTVPFIVSSRHFIYREWKSWSGILLKCRSGKLQIRTLFTQWITPWCQVLFTWNVNWAYTVCSRFSIVQTARSTWNNWADITLKCVGMSLNFI